MSHSQSSFKLLPKLRELLAERAHLALQLLNFGFHRFQAGRIDEYRWASFGRRGRRRLFLNRQQLHVSAFFLAGPRRRDARQWIFGPHEVLQGGFHRREAEEREQSIGPRSNFADGLRTTEQEDAKRGELPFAEIVMVRQRLPEFDRARSSAPHFRRQFLLPQLIESMPDNGLGVLNNRITVRCLIARVDQAVQR